MPIAQLAAHPGLESLQIVGNSWKDEYWTPANDARIVGGWSAWVESQRGKAVPSFTSVGGRMEVPAGDALPIEFERTEQGEELPSSRKNYKIIVDAGRSYVTLGVLVPFVYEGSRTAELTPAPGTNDLRLGIERDWHVTGAAMVTVFPLGRQKGQMTSFRNCRSASCIENWLGAQFGTGLDKALRDWYVGAVFAPISGVAVGAGASLLKGDFLAPGRAEGMFMPSLDPSAVNSQYMVRPYLGVSLTLDILPLLSRAGQAM
jgi:hypothetical protein